MYGDKLPTGFTDAQRNDPNQMVYLHRAPDGRGSPRIPLAPSSNGCDSERIWLHF